MAQDLELALRIRADVKSARDALDAVNRELGRVGTTARRPLPDPTRAMVSGVTGAVGAFGKLERAVFSVRGALAGLGAVAALRSITSAGLAVERMERGLLAATGSAGEAQAAMRFVRAEAERLGLDLESAGSQFAALSAAARGTALAGQATRDIFSAVSEAATVMGLSADQTAGALTAIQQIISKGTVSAEELRGQLGERLPGAFQIAARAMGVTTAELGKMLQAGEVSAEQMLPALARELRNTFGAGLSAATRSAQAAINRFRTQLFNLQAEIARSGFLEGLTEGLQAFSEGLQDPELRASLRDLGRGLGDLIANAGQLADKIKLIGEALLTLGAARAGAGIGGALFGPPGALGGALIGGAVAGGTLFADDIGRALPGGQMLEDALARGQAQEDQLRALGESLRGAAGNVPVIRIGEPGAGGATPPVGGQGGTGDDKAAQDRADAIAKIVAALREQAATEGQTAEQVALYRLAQLGADEATLARARGLIDTIALTRDEAAAMEASRDAAERQAEAIRKARMADEAVLKALAEEIRLFGMTARERAQDEAVRRLSIEATDEQREAVRALAGALYDASEAARENGEEMSAFAEQAARNMQDAFAQFLFDPFQGGLDGMLLGLVDVLRRMASEAIAAQIFERLGVADKLGGILGAGDDAAAAAAQQAAATAAAATLAGGGTATGTAIATGATTGAGALTAAGAATAASIVAGAKVAAAILSGAGAAGAAGGEGGEGGSILGFIGPLISGLFHTGGIAGQASQHRELPALAFLSAPRFHDGGIAGLGADEMPAILRRDEEVLTRDDPRHRFNLGGSSEPPVVNIRNINAFDGATIRDEMSSSAGERVILNIVSRNKRLLGIR